jgi:putative CocE/NonD family hydrolase
MFRLKFGIWFCLVGSIAAFFAQGKADAPEFDVKAHYTKYEYRVPMRDGVHLFTSVYVPKDRSHSYPFLIDRTPYSVAPYGVDIYRTYLGPSLEFDRAGYIFVFQDVRGRYMSEGKWTEMRPHIDDKKSRQDVDESSDLYDTIDWLLKNVPDNNGNAGIWGISYPGFFTSASIIDSHPALKAASPQAPMTDLFMGDDAYHGGAFMLAANFGFYSFFKPQHNPQLPPKGRVPFDWGTKDAYEFYLNAGPLSNLNKYLTGNTELWDDQVQHATYDAYWKARNLAPHMKGIHCAVLTVGGWFDAEDLQGPFSTFHSIDEHNPGIFNALVVGPWVHGGWARYDGERLGRVEFASKTGEYYRENILFPFFEQYLKGKGDAKLPKAYVFETGTNVWRQYSAWPPKDAETRTLYFQPGGGLSFEVPQGGTSFDEYLSDPAKPVPFVDYAALNVPQEYMVSDQRFADSRTDVLVYQTPVLEEDVTIAGPILPKLFVSTSGTDSDWDVKLIDVYPADYPDSKQERRSEDEDEDKPRKDVAVPDFVMGGYQQLVRGEPFRGKFRHSFEKPEPFTPGKIEEIKFAMPDINHTFRRGHRIMVQVQSSWFPLTDRNPQTFVNIPNAKPSDFVKATERVYHSRDQASGMTVEVLSHATNAKDTK